MMFHNPGCWKILLLLTGILVPTTFAFTLPSKLAPVIGIDLGTTYSCVGVYRNDHVEIIANDQGKRTTPSWVTFTDTGHLVGDSAKNQSALTSERTIFDVKRLIGRKFDDPEVQRDKKMLPYKIVNKDGKPYIQVQIKDGETKVFSPEEISAMILQKMKEMAESYLGMSIKDAVIAVPAYFDDAQRQATKDAGTISGLNVEMIIDEPIAAAIAYGLDKKGGEMNILVFDLGGGTFDVTILRYSVYGVFAKNGDTHLGGEDFDHRVMEYLIKLIKKRHNKDISEDKNALGKLKKECERAKRVLSSQNQVLVAIESLFDGIDFSEPLTRARFEELNMDLFEKTMSPVKKALEDAKLKKNDIHEILLVGGSTRIPKVQQLLKDFFDGKELSQGVNPDEAVAFGAAIEGAILTGEYDRGPVFQELLGGPLRYAVLWSLGIETAGVMTKLIPRYTKMPTKKSHIITTSQDQQTKVEIKVCQGETKDCRELARLELSGISPAPRGVPQIEVTLEVDEHVLFVTAEDKASTNKISIRLLTGMNQVDGHVLFGTAEDKESTNKKSVWLMTGMNQDEFDQMLKEMKEEEEKKRKESYASRVKLETYIADMRIRDEHKLADKIDSDDKEKFESALKDALQWLSDNRHYADKDDFDEKRRELEDVCNPVINKAYEATTKSPTTHFKDEL